jgi:uncharacterized protein with NAD-binding domain and iron-sulfur cluster
MSEAPGRRKIAILGGGAGALAAAFGLTEAPDWQQRYEITVYQVGWRLGGKGASGRNADCQQRIEEHGLHVWGGFYENAFRLMRACYQKLARPAGRPLATVWDAFKPQPNITLTENTEAGWEPVNVELPVVPGEYPGSGEALPGVWTWIRRLVAWMRQRLDELSAACEKARGAHPDLVALERLLPRMADDIGQHTAMSHDILRSLLGRFRDRLHALYDCNASGRSRFLWSVLDLASTSLKGIVEDGVLFHGFASIDHWEWSDWLRHHGIHETTLHSAIVRGTYDYVFGFANGDVNHPSVAAGVCTHGLLRLGFTWRGAVFYEMQAGMGDTVFAPLYEYLSRQGVRFRFFHRIDHLGLDANRNRVETITVSRQVNLKDTRPEAEYAPLVMVKGLPCWPSAPLYEQLDAQDARELQQKGIDLESPWADWQPRATLHLRRGTDFDDVVLGISLGALPDICTELSGKGQAVLVPAQERWKDMLERIGTVQTLAMQVWLTPDAKGLGWPCSNRPATVLTAFADPFNTWGDMSHLLGREDWPAGDGPRSIAYFCGPLIDLPGGPPSTSDHGFPGRQQQQVKAEAIAFLPEYLRALWPAAFDTGGQFRWELLIAPQAATGSERFDAQFWRANISPSERYVLSLPGTTPYRLPAGASGFANLYLAGDWVRTSINAGCVEAAVMAGFKASRALCGYPREVIGDPD